MDMTFDQIVDAIKRDTAELLQVVTTENMSGIWALIAFSVASVFLIGYIIKRCRRCKRECWMKWPRGRRNGQPNHWFQYQVKGCRRTF